MTHGEVIRDYELASGMGLEMWLERVRERDGLVPTDDPTLRVDDIGRTVLRFRLSPEHERPELEAAPPVAP